MQRPSSGGVVAFPYRFYGFTAPVKLLLSVIFLFSSSCDTENRSVTCTAALRKPWTMESKTCSTSVTYIGRGVQGVSVSSHVQAWFVS